MRKILIIVLATLIAYAVGVCFGTYAGLSAWILVIYLDAKS